MKAIIPVAGYATRLHPLTIDQPKALLSLGGSTILGQLFDKLEKVEEIDEIVLVSNDKFFGHFSDWAELQDDRSFDVTVINDGTLTNEDRLGAVGDIVKGLDAIQGDHDVVIMAGDGIFDDSFEDKFEQFRTNGNSLISVKQLPIEQCSRFGIVETDAAGQVTGFVEKPETPPSNLVGIMAYIIHKDDVSHIRGGYQDWKEEKEMNAGEIIRYMLESGVVFETYTVEGAWFDVGTHEQLKEAQNYYNKTLIRH